MQYEVKVVQDHELPEGTDLVIVDRGPHTAPVMLLSGRPAEAYNAMRKWECMLGAGNESTLLYAVS